MFLTQYFQLDVGKNVGITDEGARAISGALEHNQSLRILYVGECSITADGEQVHIMLMHVHVCMFVRVRACTVYVFMCVRDCRCDRA